MGEWYCTQSPVCCMTFPGALHAFSSLQHSFSSRSKNKRTKKEKNYKARDRKGRGIEIMKKMWETMNTEKITRESGLGRILSLKGHNCGKGDWDF